VLKNERVDVWLDGTSGDDANDGLSQANAVKTDARLAEILDGAKFAEECRRLVINLRGTIVLTGAGGWDIDTGMVEDADFVRPKVFIDGGPDLTELLAPVACTGSASGLTEIMALLNDLRTQYEAHRQRGVGVGHPGGADAVNVITAPPATDFDTTLALANQLRDVYEAHRVDTTPHGSADATNAVTANYGFDLKSFTELANDLKAQYNAHMVDVTGAPPIHDAVGADTVTVADATKATAIAGSSVALAAAGWTASQWRGYWCEFTSGPLSGEQYLIRESDTDTLYFNGEWTLDAVVGSTFRIVRPATVINGALPFPPAPPVFYYIGGAFNGIHDIHVQNLTLTQGALLKTATVGGRSDKCHHYWSHIVNECKPFQIIPWYPFPTSVKLTYYSELFDCSLPDCDQIVGASRCGVSQGNLAVLLPAVIWGVDWEECYDSALPRIAVVQSRPWCEDSSFGAMHMVSSRGGVPPRLSLRCRFGGLRLPPPFPAVPILPALILENSLAAIDGGIFDGGTHGIELKSGGHMSIFGGMGSNQLTGVYAHDKSSVGIYRDAGATANCEITGNAGTVELSEDGVTEVSKWAAIDGLPVSTPDCSASPWFSGMGPNRGEQ
jgi:hypothetical protein